MIPHFGESVGDRVHVTSHALDLIFFLPTTVRLCECVCVVCVFVSACARIRMIRFPALRALIFYDTLLPFSPLREREGEPLFDDDATSEDKDELQDYPRDARNLLSAFDWA